MYDNIQQFTRLGTRNRARPIRSARQLTAATQQSRLIHEINVTVFEMSIVVNSRAAAKRRRNLIACVKQNVKRHISGAGIYSVFLETVTKLASGDNKRAKAAELS